MPTTLGVRTETADNVVVRWAKGALVESGTVCRVASRPNNEESCLVPRAASGEMHRPVERAKALLVVRNVLQAQRGLRCLEWRFLFYLAAGKVSMSPSRTRAKTRRPMLLPKDSVKIEHMIKQMEDHTDLCRTPCNFDLGLELAQKCHIDVQ